MSAGILKSAEQKKVTIAALSLALCAAMTSVAQAPLIPQTPVELVNAMTARERDAAAHHDRYVYLSVERSDRTGGHLWMERVVETAAGHVRFLMEEDGKPLAPDRARAELARMADMAARPDELARREQAAKNDDLRARDMLGKLPNGFVLENVRLEGGVWRLNYRPDPRYSPSGVEDRILHNMNGSFVIDAHDLRLIHIDGRLQGDVGIGFGLLATVRAGSNFTLDKQSVEGNWRAVHTVTDIRGKAIMFKTISRSTDFTRSEFHKVDPNITVAQAVALAER